MALSQSKYKLKTKIRKREGSALCSKNKSCLFAKVIFLSVSISNVDKTSLHLKAQGLSFHKNDQCIDVKAKVLIKVKCYSTISKEK